MHFCAQLVALPGWLDIGESIDSSFKHPLASLVEGDGPSARCLRTRVQMRTSGLQLQLAPVHPFGQVIPSFLPISPSPITHFAPSPPLQHLHQSLPLPLRYLQESWRRRWAQADDRMPGRIGQRQSGGECGRHAGPLRTGNDADPTDQSQLWRSARTALPIQRALQPQFGTEHEVIKKEKENERQNGWGRMGKPGVEGIGLINWRIDP